MNRPGTAGTERELKQFGVMTLETREVEVLIRAESPEEALAIVKTGHGHRQGTGRIAKREVTGPVREVSGDSILL